MSSELNQFEQRFRSFAGQWWQNLMASKLHSTKKICSDDDWIRLGQDFHAQGFTPRDEYLKKQVAVWNLISDHNQKHHGILIRTYLDLAAFVTQKPDPNFAKTNRNSIRRQYQKLLWKLANPERNKRNPKPL